MITLPKRKLRFWYNKNDYLKEKENEKKLAEQNQTEEVEESIAKTEMVEQAGIDNSVQQVASNESQQIDDKTKLSEAETQDKTVPTDTQANQQQTEIPNQQQTEVPAEQVIVPEQVPNKENNIQVEPNKETATTSTENQQSIPENEVKPQLTETEVKAQLVEPEVKETAQPDKVVAPIEPKQEEAQVELKWVKDLDKLADPLTRPNPEQVTVPVESSVQMTVPVESTKEVEMVETENKVPLTESVVDIGKFTDNLARLLPTKGVVFIGEYPINIVLKGSVEGKRSEGVFPIFVEKSTKDVIKWSQGQLDNNNIVCLDEDVDTHFWYDILPYVVDNENFFAKIKSKPIEKLQGAIVVSTVWNGIGSALLPSINNQFKEWNINSIALPLLPSKSQTLDGQFNTFASLGILASKDTTLLLVERDNLESYIGVDRKGSAINGNIVISYLLDLMLAKETFAAELCEISKSFDSKMFTPLLASGLSLKIYGSIENMLDTTLLRPLFTFDLATSTVLYVLIRLPFNLKETLTRGKIELAISNWFENKADLESIYVADPIYVDESNDRLDMALFVGGFETTARFAALEKRVERMKNKAVKKGSITEEDWKLITKSLLE